MKNNLDELQRVTEELGKAMSMVAHNSGATCSALCHGCCHLLWHVSLIEGVQVAWWLYEHDRAVPELGTQLQTALMLMLDPATGKWKEPIPYLREQRPCVFLSQRAPNRWRCSIYQGRPLTCRAHFVSSPPELCEPTYDGRDPLLVLDRSLWSDKATEIAKVAEDMLHLPPDMRGVSGPLPLMVLTGLTLLSKGPLADETRALLTLKPVSGSVTA